MSEQNKPSQKETSHNETRQSRRQLLKNIGLSVAAGAAVAGTATAVQAKVDKPEGYNKDQDDNTTGYRETQHIRDYYETL
ncbi:twin-arginine translocation signal domain-containing protein [Photobacterium rosenbergii]|uniref:Twin-arginine translocation signal domain-containing protein n=1 Tax=Photobacterium rosenbergii TaxID=294936 RepID=A0ABU3ZF82_9GAMM|nr:twin-arginine translocation signal domain-containing protein [Photobacterium rosenbergii]MDV5168760.1 twin-arginine translocation signal domain-containing protein [Photobacterium rosenbergii]